MKIDKNYFKKYAGRSESYDEIFEEHSYAPECVDLFSSNPLLSLRSVAVLGAATGKVLPLFEKGLGMTPAGCEISDWAYERIPARFLKSVEHSDMQAYVSEQLKNKRRVDLVFSNAFVYLDEEEIPSFFKQLSRYTRYVHFRSSFLGDACPDPYRKTLKPLKWWDEKFQESGFELFAEGSYLWQLSLNTRKRKRGLSPYKVPRLPCSRSMASKSALKFPFPKD